MIDSRLFNNHGKGLDRFHYVGIFILSFYVLISMLLWKLIIASRGSTPILIAVWLGLVAGFAITSHYIAIQARSIYFAKSRKAFSNASRLCHELIEAGNTHTASSLYKQLAKAYAISQIRDEYVSQKILYNDLIHGLNTHAKDQFTSYTNKIKLLVEQNKLFIASLGYKALLWRYHSLSKKPYITAYTKHEIYSSLLDLFRFYKAWKLTIKVKTKTQTKQTTQTPEKIHKIELTPLKKIHKDTKLDKFFELARKTQFNQNHIKAALSAYQQLAKSYAKLPRNAKEKAYATITLAYHKEQRLISNLLIEYFKEKASILHVAITKQQKVRLFIKYKLLKLEYQQLIKKQHIPQETKVEIFNILNEIVLFNKSWNKLKPKAQPSKATTPRTHSEIQKHSKIDLFFAVAKQHRLLCIANKAKNALKCYKKLSRVYDKLTLSERKEAFATIKLAFLREQDILHSLLISQFKEKVNSIRKLITFNSKFHAKLKYLLLQREYRKLATQSQLKTETKQQLYKLTLDVYQYYTSWFGKAKLTPQRQPKTTYDKIIVLASELYEYNSPHNAAKAQKLYKKIYYKYLTLPKSIKEKVYDIVKNAYEHQLSLVTKNKVIVWRTKAQAIKTLLAESRFVEAKIYYQLLQKEYGKIKAIPHLSLKVKQQLYTILLEIFAFFNERKEQVKQFTPTDSLSIFKELCKDWQTALDNKFVIDAKIAYNKLLSVYNTFPVADKKKTYKQLIEMYHTQVTFTNEIKVSDSQTEADKIISLIEQDRLLHAKLDYTKLMIHYRRIQFSRKYTKETKESMYKALTSIYNAFKLKKAERKQAFKKIKESIPDIADYKEHMNPALQAFYKELTHWQLAIKEEHFTRATIAYKLLNRLYKKLPKLDKHIVYHVISRVYKEQKQLINVLKIKQIKEHAFNIRKHILEGKLHRAKLAYTLMLWKYHTLKRKAYISLETKEAMYNELTETYKYYESKKQLQKLPQTVKKPTLTEYFPTTNPVPAVFLVILLVVGLGFITTQLSITGYTIYEGMNQVEPINLTFTENGEINLTLKDAITSLSLTGSIKGSGSAKVFIEHNKTFTLVFDSKKANSSQGVISTDVSLYPINYSDSGPPVKVVETIPDIIENISENTTSNVTLEIEVESETSSIEEVSIEEEEKSKEITTHLTYRERTEYDTNNDGIAYIDEIIDLSVERTHFNWDVDDTKLCTRWKLTPDESLETTTYCTGSTQCCNFVELAPSSPTWNDIQYIYKGLHDTTENNTVEAQVLFVDFNLSLENAYSKIYTSEYQTLPIQFIDQVVEFENICEESCIMDKINGTESKLIIEIEDASLSLDWLTYKTEVRLPKRINPPILRNEIPELIMYKNTPHIMQLSAYIEDKDTPILNYTYLALENINITFVNNTAIFTPNENYTGTEFTFFKANDSENIAVSNIFAIIVREEPIRVEATIQKSQVILGQPVKWTKRVILDDFVKNITINVTDEASNIALKKYQNGQFLEVYKEFIKVKYKRETLTLEDYEIIKQVEVIDENIDNLQTKKQQNIPDNRFVQQINRDIITLKEQKNSITGAVIIEDTEPGLLTQFFGFISTLPSEITGAVTSEIIYEDTNTTSIIVEDSIEELEIEFTTPGPESVEETLSGSRKRITISSETHYENILAFTNITPTKKKDIKLYHIVNDSRIVTNITSYEDTNNDTFIEKIYWIVPHLSNQTYELELLIFNVQSYPEAGHNWTVEFNTSGTANLTLRAFNTTTYAEIDEDNFTRTFNESYMKDLEVKELKCGDEVIFNYDAKNASENVVFIIEDAYEVNINATLNASLNLTAVRFIDYTCNTTAYWTVRTVTHGAHHQLFTFGNINSSAHNDAAGTTCGDPPDGSSCSMQTYTAETVCIDTGGNNAMDSSDYCHDNTECGTHAGASCDEDAYGYPTQGICISDNTCSAMPTSGEFGTGLTGGAAANFHDGDESAMCDSSTELEVCSNGGGYDPTGDGVCVEDTCSGGNAVVLKCTNTDCATSDVSDDNVEACDAYTSLYGSACDSSIATNWIQDGICDGSGNCATTGYICLDAYSMYYADSCGTSCSEGDQCDATLTDGDFDSTYGTCDASTNCVAAGGNNEPVLNEVKVNSTDPFNRTIGDLTCWVNATDEDADTINVYVRWFNQSVEWAHYTDFKSATAATDNVPTLIDTLKHDANLTQGNVNWICMVGIDDGTANATAGQKNSSALLTKYNYTFDHADHTDTATMNIHGSINSSISSSSIILENQTINLTHPTGGLRAAFFARFDRGHVNLSNFTLFAGDTITVINYTGLSGVDTNFSIFVPNTSSLGVYVCPDANVSNYVNISCPGLVRFTLADAEAGTTKSGYRADFFNGSYKISNITGSGSGENDTFSPAIINESIGPNQNFTVNKINFNVSTNEPGNCTFSYNNTANTSMTNLNATLQGYTNNYTAPGPNNITFYCNDTIGNYNNTELFDFYVLRGDSCSDGNECYNKLDTSHVDLGIIQMCAATNSINSVDSCYNESDYCANNIGKSCDISTDGTNGRKGVCTPNGCANTTIVSGEYGTGLSGGVAATFHSGNENASCDSTRIGMICNSTGDTLTPLGDSMCSSGDICGATSPTIDCVDTTCSTSEANTLMDTCGSQGWACMSAYAGGGFVQDGICDNGEPGTCQTSGHICNTSNTLTHNGCDGACIDDDPCDATLTDGNYDNSYGTCSGSDCVASGGNTAPVINQVIINTTEDNNYTTANVTAWINATDADANTINAYIRWFNNSIEWPDQTDTRVTPIADNVFVLVDTVNWSLTRKNENWTAMIQIDDGTVNATAFVNASLIVNNSPTNITFTAFNATGLTNYTNETLYFWYQLTDRDNETTFTTYYRWFKDDVGIGQNGTINITLDTLTNISFINSDNTSSGEVWNIEITHYDGNSNSSPTNYTMTIADAIPVIYQVIINSTSVLNRTDENLTCWVNATDTDGDTINAYTRWFNESTEIDDNTDVRTASINDNVFTLIDSIYFPNTTKNLNWTCMVQIDDGTANATAWINSSILNITNTPPGIPLQSYPIFNSSITNRSTVFNWTGVGDIDNDTVSYILKIERINCGDQNLNCHTSSIEVKYIEDTEYIIIENLDVDSRYNWSINATDNESDVGSADSFNFTVDSKISIALTNATIDFGTLNGGVINDTETGTPTPVMIENDGNVFVNITINASKSLWTAANSGINTEFWQFQAGNHSETPSFNWSGSQKTFTDVLDSETQVIRELNWSDATDQAELDFNITVPEDEFAGSKSATITITARWYTNATT
tara:strand:- start:2084 stop:11914 length:9831 start_codon:yes stop_codon:yes gene_type:complete